MSALSTAPGTAPAPGHASARWWRAALISYAVLLTVGTHWPALTLGTEEAPAPDKILHMIAFTITVLLLWQSRWFTRPWIVIVLAMAWAALDEMTQALPILRRTMSVQDLLAGQMGILVAVAWWWALAPVGGPANRTRIAWQHFVVDQVLSRPVAWVITGLAGLLGGALVGAVAWVAAGAALAPDSRLVAAVLAVFGGAVAGAHAALAAQYRRRGIPLVDVQPCLACAATCRDVAFDARGRGACPGCGQEVRRGQWMRPMELPASALLRGTWRSALLAVGLVVAALAAYLLLGWFAPANRVVRAWNDLSLDMRVAIDLMLMALAAATAVRIGRVRQAALFDGQARRCRICRHDLTAATLDRGVGRCPECGTPFAALT